jgi:hypothetical protein
MRRARATALRERPPNEYLDEVRSYVSEDDFVQQLSKARSMAAHIDLFHGFSRRPLYVEKYAWGVPNEEALATIAKYGPIVEIGAGTGYWAYLLRKRGVRVRAFDIHPPPLHANHYHPDQKLWSQVLKGSWDKAAEYPDHALFLCWPPYATHMADHALAVYRGDTVIYIGEWDGCTANGAFHKRLEREFEQVERVTLPKWPGIKDFLSVWKRKKKPCRQRVTVSRSAVIEGSERTATAASRGRSSKPSTTRPRTPKRKRSSAKRSSASKGRARSAKPS